MRRAFRGRHIDRLDAGVAVLAHAFVATSDRIDGLLLLDWR